MSRLESKRARIRNIRRCAIHLTETQGFDAFTMDDLATEVGVSRRTLFNYTGDKASAVLGVPLELDPDRVAVLIRERKPGQSVLARAAELLVGHYSEVDLTPDDYELTSRATRLIGTETKLVAAMEERTTAAVDALTAIVAESEGWGIDDKRARIFARTLVALVDEAWRATIAASAYEGAELPIRESLVQFIAAYADLNGIDCLADRATD